MDGTFPDILLPWRPEHPGEVLSLGCLPCAPNSGVSPLPNSEGGNTWQLDSNDEEEERVMILRVITVCKVRATYLSSLWT